MASAHTSASGVALERPTSALLLAGVLTGVTDGLFACVLSVVFYESTVTRLFQGVASTLLGPDALNGGTRTAMIGGLMHFGVAFGWSAVFLLLIRHSAWIRRRLAAPSGVFTLAAVYGPFVWLVMSLIVIPLLMQRPPRITLRWWIQLAGHAPFVGLPIVATLRRTVTPRGDVVTG